MAYYVPENLDTDVYCFVCDANAGRADYELSPWRALARTAHDRHVPGDRNTCVTTFAGVVAKELQGILAGRNPPRGLR